MGVEAKAQDELSKLILLDEKRVRVEVLARKG